MRPVPGKVIAERYLLERPLASGGMGTIWVAKHLTLGVPAALKFMAEDLHDTRGGRMRFEREARAAARIQSPHVARVYDYGTEDGTPFIAMELLVGESLEDRLRRETRLPTTEAARIFRQVAKGLREAHALGIVHRDLKPANLFIAEVGGEEVVKILDFGIAKETQDVVADDDRTRSGTLLGSPHHMSPEQARGAEVDTRSDLWSLGVVLFRMVTGHKPFAGTNMGDIIAKICADAIPKPSTFVASLGPAVDAFFEHALRRSPELRFQSLREMTDAFDEAVGVAPQEPESLRRPPALTDAARAARGEAVADDADAASDGVAPPSVVIPRADVTRDVAVAPAPAQAAQDGEATAIGTTADKPAPATREGLSRRGLVLSAFVVCGVALAVVLSWQRFNQHRDIPSSTAAPGPVASFALGQTPSSGPGAVRESTSALPTAVETAPVVEPVDAPAALASSATTAAATPPAGTGAGKGNPRATTPKPTVRRTGGAPRAKGDPFF